MNIGIGLSSKYHNIVCFSAASKDLVHFQIENCVFKFLPLTVDGPLVWLYKEMCINSGLM